MELSSAWDDFLFLPAPEVGLLLLSAVLLVAVVLMWLGDMRDRRRFPPDE